MRLSILIPTYNRARTLRRAVDSALAGGWDGELELVVSDNASSDGSAAVLAELEARVPEMRILRQPTNVGPLGNWRACLAEARGDLVHWLWSDDWIAPGAYRAMQTAMLHERASMAICAVHIIPEGEVPVDPAAAPLGEVHHRLGDRAWVGRDLVHKLLTVRRPLVSPVAALLPTTACRRVLAARIPEQGDLRCDVRAIGPDALMILEGALASERVASLDRPLAYCSAGVDSISMIESDHRLSAHYAWARLGWCRERGLPWTWRWADILRLLRRQYVGPAAQAVFR